MLYFISNFQRKIRCYFVSIIELNYQNKSKKVKLLNLFGQIGQIWHLEDATENLKNFGIY